jgi:hypothetical protein
VATTPASAPLTLPRADFSATVEEFLRLPADAVLGRLVAHAETYATEADQTNAWLDEIPLLQHALAGVSGTLMLEFHIPRFGRRADAILLSGPVVFVLEFKTTLEPGRAGLEQVWDYALDLKYFHAASHAAAIVPVLVAPGAPSGFDLRPGADGVYEPFAVAPEALPAVLAAALAVNPAPPIDAAWAAAPYRPTPTILEAARALYARHTVADIARFDAGADNLGRTTRRLEELLGEAQRERRKLLCLVTGVPGAGKTLAGLNLATRHARNDETHAVFLSGNDPLVAVLREALVRDELGRRKAAGEKPRKSDVARPVESFLQNVRHFRDEGLRDPRAPHEHIAIFDEAQRAWTRAKLAQFMARRRNHAGFEQSEPEFLLACMARHPDWAAVIGLVGGGQEINTGEAGIGAWLEAAAGSPAAWDIRVSPHLQDSEYAAGGALERAVERGLVHFEEDLHLAVSLRSFRAESLSAFVKALLDLDRDAAQGHLARLGEYPLAVTRDLQHARNWLRARARSSERYGLLASSKALRLKPHAIDVRVQVDPIHYFLGGPADTRSSWYLEDAASEFDVQGLELDWACVTWDADLRFAGDGWKFRDFRGERWTTIHSGENQAYLKNAYRVLLTRARQGLVIFVPPGDAADPTRDPAFYNATFDYLTGLGLPAI